MPAIDMGGKPECAAQHKGAKVREQTVIVGAKGALANVVVSINTPEGQTLPAIKPTAAAELTQKGCMYEPHVLAMQVGQKLVIKNDDPFMHNVHSQSDNVPFNFAQPNVDQGKPAPTPKQAEYFHVKCDVHPWMSAWIAVLDNGYFAVTKEDGTFEIPKGLPDGDYTVTFWQEKFDKSEPQALHVTGGKGTIDYSFKQEGASAGAPKETVAVNASK
jgi:plastocyanin